jgi:hypothetical protein
MVEINSFARPVRVESIPRDGLAQMIEASPAERAAVAKLAGLPAIGRLAAELTLRPTGRGIIHVRGEVHAEVTQICVVSLEPFDATLNEPVDVRFAAPMGEAAGRRGPPITAAEAESLTIGDQDAPDPIIDGKIDLGALAVEFMILGLDPYPRKPGARFTAPSNAEGGDPPLASLGEEPKDN